MYNTIFVLVVTNSTLLSTPLVTAAVKPTLVQPAVTKANTPLSSLGPGTLILANGSIVPVLPSPTPIIPQRPSIITNPTPLLLNQQAVVVVTTNFITHTTASSKTTQVSSKTVSYVNRSLAHIKPKRCTTKTVQANKVPIPALTSRYASSCIVISGKNTSGSQQQKKNNEQHKKSSEGGETLKRKLEGSTKDDATAVKQQKGDDSNVNDKQIETKVTETSTIVTSEDKVEQKKVTSYSIDSICKEKEQNEKVDDTPKANPESGESLKQSNETVEVEVQNAVDNNVAVTTSEDTSAISTTACSLPNSKADEIPENVLKEIENNKNDKVGDSEINLPHSELSNDIFASLQVQSGGQNPESTSPTAAFLLAFPLVSTLTGVKVSEVIEEDNSDSQRGTPTLLQIGTMDSTKPTQSNADNLTPSLLNLDNFSFFSSKDICSSFYQPFDTFVTSTTATTQVTTVSSSSIGKSTDKKNSGNKNIKLVYDTPTTKDRGFPALASSENFVNKTVKNSQPFNVASQPNKTVQLEKPVLPTETQQQRQHQQRNASIDNSLAIPYNSYNYTPTVSTYNTTNHHKTKCSTMNTYNTSTRPNQTVAQCNTFNPFAETVKYSSSVCCYNSVTKPYIDSLYTNPSTYSYNCQTDVGFNQASYSVHKNSQKAEEKPYYSMNYNNSYNGDARSNVFSNNYCQMHNKDKFNSQTNKNKTVNNQTRPPVNWMTTPDIRHQSTTNNDYLLPCFSKDLENGVYPTVASNTQTTYFNTNTSIYPTPELTYSFPDAKKTLESTFPSVSSFQRNDLDDNQFTWSPTKFPQLLDPSHSFVSSALPTLVGDLALGNTSMTFSDQKADKSKDVYNRQKDVRRNKPSNYESHVNFLSVSQLVDHNKAEAMPARTASRRNSGNRSSKQAVQQKTVKRNQKDAKDNQNYHTVSGNKAADKMKQAQVVQNNSYNLQQDWIGDAAKQKNPSSSYSAEALIGHQPLSDDVGAKQRNNNSVQCGYSATSSLPVSFLTDNIIPYFPPVELQQDTTFVQNQNCQNNSFSHNFSSTSIQSNTYSSASLIASTPSITTNYLPASNFMSEIGTHDYNPIISENLNLFPHGSKTCMKSSNSVQKQVNRQEERKLSAAGSSACSANNFSKKTKKKHTNENNVPGFVDFSFLSMPAAINSPILPDDFHANLLAPPTPQLYSCKNPLYPKQNAELNAGSSLLPLPPVPVSRSNIQHPEISPSVNNVGTSLTNFNLSTIFPEINKVGIVRIAI